MKHASFRASFTIVVVTAFTLLASLGALTALGTTLLACGSDTEFGSREGAGATEADGGATLAEGAPATATALSGACPNLRTAFTERGERCHQPSTYGAWYDQVCARTYSAPGSTVTVAEVDACANAVRALPCDRYEIEIEACAFLTRAKGTLPNGSPCASAGQCATGVCNGARIDVNELQCGTCAAPRGTGEPCARGLACAEGAQCLSRTTRTTDGQTKETCEPIVPEGGACSNATSCGAMAFCDPQRNVCTKNPSAGEPCALPVANGGALRVNCRGTLVCVDGACALPHLEGEPCVASECAWGLRCDSTTKRCISRTAALGDACGSFSAICGNGLACHDSRCVSRIAPGGACEPDGTPCAEFHLCSQANGCVPIDPHVCK